MRLIKPSGNNIIKYLLIAKGILLLSILFYLSDDFYFREKSSFAKKKEIKTVETKKENIETPPVKKERKSFLSDLLNLPEINDIEMKSDTIGKYLTLAERKKQQVDQRLALLKTREDQLKKIEATIDSKLNKLEEERLFFIQSVQKEKEVKKERLERLVKFYSKMEPKKAGPVFEQLNKDLTVAMFQKMQQKRITKILESMSPERSVKITEYYGRIKSGKEYELLKEMNVSLRKTFDECKGMPAH